MAAQWNFVFEEGTEENEGGAASFQEVNQAQQPEDTNDNEQNGKPVTQSKRNKVHADAPKDSTKTTKNTKWNFTGARLKPHVVGVHFDKHSQYMGNWQGNSTKAQSNAVNMQVQTRPKRQIKRSLKKLANRTSAPSQYHSKVKPNIDHHRRSVGSHHYVVKPVDTQNLCGDNFRNPNHPVELPHLHELAVPEEYSQSYMGDFRAHSGNAQYYNPQGHSYAPEPLYRSVSMPHNQHHPAGMYTGHFPSGHGEVLDISDNYSPGHLQERLYQQNVNKPESLQRHSSLTEPQASRNFEFEELQFHQEEARIEPTHVYFNEEPPAFQNQTSYNAIQSPGDNRSRQYYPPQFHNEPEFQSPHNPPNSWQPNYRQSN